MKQDVCILMVGLNGIDCFFGLATTLEDKGVVVKQTHSIDSTQKSLSGNRYDAILVNLEPDGWGGVHGIEILPDIIESQSRHNTVCFSVSAESTTTLLKAEVRFQSMLSIIAGWLTLPIEHEKAARLILDIVHSPKSLSIKNRLPGSEE